MFQRFQKKGKNTELDTLIQELQMNASNNYKDAAQASLQKFITALEILKSENRLSQKQISYYEKQLMDFQADMIKFTHADQKATWD